MAEQTVKEKPCPYCHSVKNEFGTCSWHCMTCENVEKKDCYKNCNYKHMEEKQNDETGI
jgi:hypothetical protein